MIRSTSPQSVQNIHHVIILPSKEIEFLFHNHNMKRCFATFLLNFVG